MSLIEHLNAMGGEAPDPEDSVSKSTFLEWLNGFMLAGKPTKMAIVGPQTARYIVKNTQGGYVHRVRGNAKQRRKHYRFFARQRARLIALSMLPDDASDRLMIRTEMPR